MACRIGEPHILLLHIDAIVLVYQSGNHERLVIVWLALHAYPHSGLLADARLEPVVAKIRVSDVGHTVVVALVAKEIQFWAGCGILSVHAVVVICHRLSDLRARYAWRACCHRALNNRRRTQIPFLKRWKWKQSLAQLFQLLDDGGVHALVLLYVEREMACCQRLCLYPLGVAVRGRGAPVPIALVEHIIHSLL